MEYKFFNELPPDSIMIREEIFVKEQGFKKEFDDLDKDSIHLVIYESNSPIANGRLYKENDSYIMGRIAVLKDYRGKHIGQNIVKLLEEKAKELGGDKVSLSAQCHAQSFYENLGYTAIGEIYLDESCEHIHMEKSL